MKIKVVDMTYEQALAQPPQVHKKPKKPSLLFRTVLRAASAPDLLATHFHCEKIGMAQIKSDEPCLVLMNHSCFLDLKIADLHIIFVAVIHRLKHLFHLSSVVSLDDIIIKCI